MTDHNHALQVKAVVKPLTSSGCDNDSRIADRLRVARRIAGLTLGELGEKCGLSAQGVHKYETGLVRIPSGRLWQFAEALRIPIGFFYDELAKESALPHNPSDSMVLDLSKLTDKQARSARRVAAMRDEDLEHLLYLLERVD